jgi:Protein of unknown function (DUF1552)
MKNRELVRRDILKSLGLGVACLPLLTGRTWAAPATKRLVILQLGQGYRQPYWKPPTGALAGGPLPFSCLPLEPWKDELIFLPDLTNPNIGTSGAGAYGLTFYGLDATGTGPYREPAGMTLDQLVGAALPRPPGGPVSLNLGVQLERQPLITRAPGANHCFWAGAGKPIKSIGNPVVAYNQLIAAAPDPATAARLLARRKSILDYVGTSLDGYGKRLGNEDRHAIGQHLQALRELEGHLPTLAARSCDPGPPPSPVDLEAATSYPKILTAHLGLMSLALKCGVTNVVTLQTTVADPQNVNVGGFIPAIPERGGYKSGPPPTLSEISRNPLRGGTDWKRIVDRWFMDHLASFLAQLRATPEGPGTLLDNVVVLVGNHMEDGSSQDAQKLPWMLAGKCGGYFATGQCLPSAGRSTASVMAAICDALGVKHPYGAAMPGLKKI